MSCKLLQRSLTLTLMITMLTLLMLSHHPANLPLQQLRRPG
jgi:hypothetical protein